MQAGEPTVRRITALVGPEGVVVAAVMAALRIPDLSIRFSGVFPALPYIVFPAGILLSFRFGRGRLMLAALVLALVERALWFLVIPGDPASRALVDVIALLIPLDLALLIFLPEIGTWNRTAFFSVVVVLSEVLMAALVAFPYPAPAAQVIQVSFLPGWAHQWTRLPDTALVLFAAAAAAALFKAWTAPSSTNRAFLWTLILSVPALSSDIQFTRAAYINTAGLVLVLAAIETSYFMAYRDALTGLPARRALNDALLRLGNRYTIAMIDVDHFKRFNDRYGHDVGDQVLRMVAAQLRRVAGGGKPFRYGGEEFAIVFPGKETDEIVPYLERLRKSIEESRFRIRSAERPKKKPDTPGKTSRRTREAQVTVSIGVAQPENPDDKPDDVIKAADSVLYKAKRAGRNRVRS